MVHVHRARTRAVEVDNSDAEPEYVREEGETAKAAQDRIEEKYRARATSPLRAIRAFCVLCMGAQPREVAHCSATTCVLYPFRAGTNPFQAGRGQGKGHKPEEGNDE